MAITRRAPNTIHLAGSVTYVEDLVCLGTITPGMLLEYRNDGGTLKWGIHDTADDPLVYAVALERGLLNKGVDDNYIAGELIRVAILHPGARAWMLIPTGQNISPAAFLQSNGDGMLKAAATGTKGFIAVESSGGAVAATTRIRVERV